MVKKEELYQFLDSMDFNSKNGIVGIIILMKNIGV